MADAEQYYIQVDRLQQNGIMPLMLSVAGTSFSGTITGEAIRRRQELPLWRDIRIFPAQRVESVMG